MEKLLRIKRVTGVQIRELLPYFDVQFEDEKLRNMSLPIQCIPHHLIFDYYHEKSLNGNALPIPDRTNERDKVHEICRAVPDAVLNSLAQRFVTRKGLELPPPVTHEVIMKKLSLLLTKFPGDNEVRDLMAEILIEMIREKRRKLRLKLREAEFDLNFKVDHTTAVKIVNHVSVDPFPDDFTVVNSNRVPDGIEMIATGCQCTECCCCSDNCGHLKKNQKMNYNIDKRIRTDLVAPGDRTQNSKLVIHECNKLCRCGPECRNRVVQRGSNAMLELYYSINGCGWGVRAMAPLTEGTFVVRYVGEIISASEVQGRRSRYIFDIDVEKPENQAYGDFAIDADKLGNLARFVNHSCHPNLRIVAVHIDSTDSRLHEIAFFTLRDIEQGEQLCIDYGPLYALITDCRCGSVSCRKNLASLGDLQNEHNIRERTSIVSTNISQSFKLNVSESYTNADISSGSKNSFDFRSQSLNLVVSKTHENSSVSSNLKNSPDLRSQSLKLLVSEPDNVDISFNSLCNSTNDHSQSLQLLVSESDQNSIASCSSFNFSRCNLQPVLVQTEHLVSSNEESDACTYSSPLGIRARSLKTLKSSMPPCVITSSKGASDASSKSKVTFIRHLRSSRPVCESKTSDDSAIQSQLLNLHLKDTSES